MNRMNSGGAVARCGISRGKPVGWRQTGRFAGLHGWQPGEHIFEVFPGVYAKAAAVLHDGIEDGAFFA